MRRPYPHLPPMTDCPECGHHLLQQLLRSSDDGGATWSLTRTLTCHKKRGQPGRCCRRREEHYE